MEGTEVEQRFQNGENSIIAYFARLCTNASCAAITFVCYRAFTSPILLSLNHLKKSFLGPVVFPAGVFEG